MAPEQGEELGAEAWPGVEVPAPEGWNEYDAHAYFNGLLDQEGMLTEQEIEAGAAREALNQPLSPEEITTLSASGEDWAGPQVPDIQALIDEQLAPYKDSLAYVQSREAELRGQDEAAAFLDN